MRLGIWTYVLKGNPGLSKQQVFTFSSFTQCFCKKKKITLRAGSSFSSLMGHLAAFHSSLLNNCAQLHFQDAKRRREAAFPHCKFNFLHKLAFLYHTTQGFCPSNEEEPTLEKTDVQTRRVMCVFQGSCSYRSPAEQAAAAGGHARWQQNGVTGVLASLLLLCCLTRCELHLSLITFLEYKGSSPGGARFPGSCTLYRM